MLKREQAEKQLAALRIKNWEKLRLEAVAKLPDKLATIGPPLVLTLWGPSLVDAAAILPWRVGLAWLSASRSRHDAST